MEKKFLYRKVVSLEIAQKHNYENIKVFEEINGYKYESSWDDMQVLIIDKEIAVVAAKVDLYFDEAKDTWIIEVENLDYSSDEIEDSEKFEIVFVEGEDDEIL